MPQRILFLDASVSALQAHKQGDTSRSRTTFWLFRGISFTQWFVPKKG